MPSNVFFNKGHSAKVTINGMEIACSIQLPTPQEVEVVPYQSMWSPMTKYAKVPQKSNFTLKFEPTEKWMEKNYGECCNQVNHVQAIKIEYPMKVWQFPKDRFIEYDFADEKWARYLGFGKEIEIKSSWEFQGWIKTLGYPNPWNPGNWGEIPTKNKNPAFMVTMGIQMLELISFIDTEAT